MLRKFANILILATFIVSTSGFTISKHYCGNKLVSVKINSEPKPCCDMTGGCCHNEIKVYQLHENFIIDQIPLAQASYILIADSNNIETFSDLSNNSEIKSIYLKKGFIPPPDLSITLANHQSFRL